MTTTITEREAYLHAESEARARSVVALTKDLQAMTAERDAEIERIRRESCEWEEMYRAVCAKADAVLAALKGQEPFGYVSEHNCQGPFQFQFHKESETIYLDNCKSITAVYTAPPQAQEQRKPLTDELIEDLRSDANRGFNIDKDDYFKAFRDAEAAHDIR